MKLLGIDLTVEEFDHLMCEQSKGKELKVVNGKVVAVDHEITEKERLEKELNELMVWFSEYDNQVKQYQRCVRLGISYDRDIKALDNEARVKQLRIAEIRAALKSI